MNLLGYLIDLSSSVELEMTFVSFVEAVYSIAKNKSEKVRT